MDKPIPLIYDSNNIKVLLDGERVYGFSHGEFVKANKDGILVDFVAFSDALKQLMKTTPTVLKAIYFDDNATITITMEVEKCKILPIGLGDDVPTVKVQFYGKPNVNFED